MTKKSRQKFKYRENEESFYDEIKNIFIIFKGLSLKQTKRIWKVKVRIERFKNLVGCRLGHLQKWFILILRNVNITAQKLKFSIMDFFNKFDELSRKLWIWSCLLKKSLTLSYMMLKRGQTWLKWD